MQPQQAQPNQPPIEAKESPLKLLPNIEDVIKSIHSTAKFSRILGILIIIIVTGEKLFLHYQTQNLN